MKKQLLLSVLFLVCFQVVMIGQDLPQLSKHEIGLNIGYSLPIGEYSSNPWYKLYDSGYFLEATYSYNKRRIKPNISLGFIRHYSSDEIEEYYKSPLDPNVSRLSYQLAEFGVLYLMPGIYYESKFKLKCMLSVNAGGVSSFQLEQRNYSLHDVNTSNSTALVWNYNTGVGLAYKAMFGFKYSINNNINLSLKTEYFHIARMKMSGLFQEFRDDILQDEAEFTVDDVNKMKSINFSLGVSYNL